MSGKIPSTSPHLDLQPKRLIEDKADSSPLDKPSDSQGQQDRYVSSARVPQEKATTQGLDPPKPKVGSPALNQPGLPQKLSEISLPQEITSFQKLCFAKNLPCLFIVDWNRISLNDPQMYSVGVLHDTSKGLNISPKADIFYTEKYSETIIRIGNLEQAKQIEKTYFRYLLNDFTGEIPELESVGDREDHEEKLVSLSFCSAFFHLGIGVEKNESVSHGFLEKVKLEDRREVLGLALARAIAIDHEEMATFFIEHGADITQADDEGRYAIVDATVPGREHLLTKMLASTTIRPEDLEWIEAARATCIRAGFLASQQILDDYFKRIGHVPGQLDL